jgi:hypothetical protein
MKFFATSLLATLAVASPIVVSPAADLSARQLGSLNPMTSNDVKDGSSSSCPKAIFIFARASGEQGNMVRYSPASKRFNVTDTFSREAPLVPLWPAL